MKNLRIKLLKRQFTNWDIFRFTSYDRIYVSKIHSVSHLYFNWHTCIITGSNGNCLVYCKNSNLSVMNPADFDVFLEKKFIDSVLSY